VEGIKYKGVPPFIVGHNWDEFAETVIMLLKSESKRLELQERARHFALHNYSAERVYAPLVPFFPKVEKASNSADEESFRKASKCLHSFDSEKEIFDSSTQILILPDPDSGFAGVTPVHQVDLLSAAGDNTSGLRLRSSGEDPCVELPSFSYPANSQLVIKIDMTSEEDTTLQVYYMTSDSRQYSESLSISRSIKKGRNVLFIPLMRTDLHGRLRLDPGKAPGDYVLHSVEIRAFSGRKK